MNERTKIHCGKIIPPLKRGPVTRQERASPGVPATAAIKHTVRGFTLMEALLASSLLAVAVTGMAAYNFVKKVKTVR